MALPEQIDATSPAVHEPMDRTSAWRLTLASPLYRGATISVFLSALGFSAAAPQIASFLVNDLGASLRAAGLFYLTNLTAPVAGYLVGRRSDRTGRRLGLFRICAVLGFAGWLGTAYSTELWMPYVISAVVGAFGGAATSQLFAAIHDEQQSHPNPNDDAVVAVVRMALTAGWVVGPVGGVVPGRAHLTSHHALRHSHLHPRPDHSPRDAQDSSRTAAATQPGPDRLMRAARPARDAAAARLHRPLRPRVRRRADQVRLPADLHERVNSASPPGSAARSSASNRWSRSSLCPSRCSSLAGSA